MPAWIETTLAAIGGGAVVLVGCLTVLKGLFVKLFETGIEASFEKKMEKYKNKLDRSTRAYEILLDREMRFYERTEPIIAELLPLESDFVYCVKPDKGWPRTEQCETLRANIMRYCELLKMLKNEIALHQVYIPNELMLAFTLVVKQMQTDLPFWADIIHAVFEKPDADVDTDKAQATADALLMLIARAEMAVKQRLQELSGEE